MNRGTKAISTVLLAGTMAAGASVASAQPFQIQTDWTLDLSVVNGITEGATTYDGLTPAENIREVTISGFTTIEQQIEDGSALGQPFTAQGWQRLIDYEATDGSVGHPLNLQGSNANQLYAHYTDLTGTLLEDPAGDLQFDAGNIVDLYISTADQPGDPAEGDALQIAELAIVDPSGGSDLNFHGGAGENATLDLTMQANWLIDEGLFKDAEGNPYEQDLTFQLVNMDALLREEGTDIFEGPGDGVSTLAVSNAGQLNLAVAEEVPPPVVVVEPHVLALFGFGFVMLAGLGLRRNRRDASGMAA